MRWINVNESYLDYLRTYEPRIPHTNYGDDRYKPFFGVLFEKGELLYITQVSHPQPRHHKMKQSLDFYKLYDPVQTDQLIAVVNINYMFPIPKTETSEFLKAEIDTYRTFENAQERSKYIHLLDKEIKAINQLPLEKNAKKLYEIKVKHPEQRLAQRCLDYGNLETHALCYVPIP